MMHEVMAGIEREIGRGMKVEWSGWEKRERIEIRQLLILVTSPPVFIFVFGSSISSRPPTGC